MIKESKWNQYGFPRKEEDIKGITIHETNNYEMNAQELCEWLENINKTSQGVHYLVDSEQIVQVMPDDWAVYHTGKGRDWGNRYTIAIEICSSLSDEVYKKAEDRAISLIYSLQKKYHIPMNMIFFHNDFDNRVHCPNRILNEYGTSKRFTYERLDEEDL